MALTGRQGGPPPAQAAGSSRSAAPLRIRPGRAAGGRRVSGPSPGRPLRRRRSLRQRDRDAPSPPGVLQGEGVGVQAWHGCPPRADDPGVGRARPPPPSPKHRAFFLRHSRATPHLSAGGLGFPDGRPRPAARSRSRRKPRPAAPSRWASSPFPRVERGYLVDPASSICLSQRLSHACLSTHGRYSETANGSLNQLAVYEAT